MQNGKDRRQMAIESRIGHTPRTEMIDLTFRDFVSF